MSNGTLVEGPPGTPAPKAALPPPPVRRPQEVNDPPREEHPSGSASPSRQIMDQYQPRISDWTLEDKILWTDLRRAAFEYAYMHRYFTTDWDYGSPRQPGAPDRWQYDLEAVNEAGRVTYQQVEIDGEPEVLTAGWDWKVPRVQVPMADEQEGLPTSRKQVIKDLHRPSQWDPRFDQETAYTDANTYLAENYPGFTLEWIDRMLVEDMGIEQDVMDWTEFRPEGPLDSNLLRKATNPILGLWEATIGRVLKTVTSSPYEGALVPEEGWDFGSLLSMGWEATESKNPLEPNPTQANRAAYVGEPGSGTDIFFPHDGIELLIDLGLIFGIGPVARGIFRIPRLFVGALNRNSAVLRERFSPATINYLQRIGLIDDTLNVTVKGRLPPTGTGPSSTGPSGTGLAPTGRTPDMGIRYRQTYHEDPLLGATTTELKVVDPALMNAEQLKVEAFLHGGLTDIRVKPGSFPSGRPLPEGGIIDAPSYVVRNPVTGEAMTPVPSTAEAAATDLGIPSGASPGRLTEMMHERVALDDVVFRTAGADYYQRGEAYSIWVQGAGLNPGVAAAKRGEGMLGKWKDPTVEYDFAPYTSQHGAIFVKPEDAASIQKYWNETGTLPLDMGTSSMGLMEPDVSHPWGDLKSKPYSQLARMEGSQVLQDLEPDSIFFSRTPEEGLVPIIYNPIKRIGEEFDWSIGLHIGEPITYVDPSRAGEMAQMSVLRAGLGNPVNMEIVDTVARRNIASLVETSTPAWEGGPTLWHGAKSDFATFDVSLADETALYGPGIYSTANPQMATTYTVSRGWEPMPNQYLHNVQWTGSEPPKIIDVEAPLPPDVREALKPFESVRIVDEQPTPPAGVDPLVYTSIDLGLDQPETTWQKVWDLIGQRSSSNPALYNTMFQGWQERRLGIAQLLVDLGYDAMTHTGGIRTAGIAVGAPEHQVYVWFDDANVISGGRAKTTGFTPQVGDMISGVPGRSLEEAARAKTEHLGSDWENLTDMELYNLVVPSGEIPGLGPGYQGPPGPGGMTMAADVPIPPVTPEDALAFALGRTILPVRRILSTHALTALPHDLQMPPPWGVDKVAEADALVVFDRLAGGEVSYSITPYLTAAEAAGTPVFNFREQHAAAGGVEEITAVALQNFLMANNVETLFVAGDMEWNAIGSRMDHHLGLTFGNQFTPSQRALPETPIGVTFERSRELFTPELLQANPDRYYLFGENVEAHDTHSMIPGGPDSGQAIIRGQDNAIGIPTKSTTREYMTDDAYEDNIQKIDEGFAKIPEGAMVVVPQNAQGLSLGAGRADLRNKAPRTWDYLEARIAQFEGEGLSGVDQTVYMPPQPGVASPNQVKLEAPYTPESNFEYHPEGVSGDFQTIKEEIAALDPSPIDQNFRSRTSRDHPEGWGDHEGLDGWQPSHLRPLQAAGTETAPLTRLMGEEGTSYFYTGKNFVAQPWSPEILRIKAEVEALTGFKFDAALVQWYPSGSTTLGWHYDRIGQSSDPEAIIASLSFNEVPGEDRIFRYRSRWNPETGEQFTGKDYSRSNRGQTVDQGGSYPVQDFVDFPLGNGDLLLMMEGVNANWEHTVLGAGGHSGRINITFRQIDIPTGSQSRVSPQVPGTPAETGPTDELSVLIREKGLFSEEEIADPVFREWIVLNAKTNRAAKGEISEPFSPEAQAIWDDQQNWGVGEGLDWEAFSRARGYTEEEIADNRRWLELQNELAWREPHNQGVEPNQFGIVWSGDHPSEIYGPDISDWPVMNRWQMSAYDDPLFDPEDPLSVPRPEYLTMEGREAREAELVEMDFGIAAPLGTPAKTGPSVDFGEWTSQWTAATGSPPSATTVAHWKWLGTSPTVESATLRSDVSVRKIVSGAQSGADQGGLYAARDLGLETDGYMPSGFKTERINEQGEPIRNKYELNPELGQMFGLREADYSEYTDRNGKVRENIWPPRTELNARMADGTLWIGTTDSPGYKLTSKHSKNWVENPTEEVFIKWLQDNDIKVLNVAGNRASTEQGLFDRVRTFIVGALREPGSGGVSPSVPPGTPAAASNVDPIVLQALEDVKGSLIGFRDEHGWPNVYSATKSKNPLIYDNYIEVPLYSFQYTSQQLQAYDDIFPEHAADRVMWLPDETKLGRYQQLYKMKREKVGTYIIQEYWRFNRLLTRYAELMGFTE